MDNRTLEEVRKNETKLIEEIKSLEKQLEYLRSDIVIHRITGDPKKEDLITPSWLLKKFCVLNEIDKEMVKMDTYQGKLVN